MPAEEEVDIRALVQRAQVLRHRLERAQEDLSRIEAEGHGGGGLVRAVMSGEHVLVDLSIDASLVDPDDPHTLTEFVREAVNDAIRALALKRNERMSNVTEGFAAGMPIPTRPGPRVTPLMPNRPMPGEQQQWPGGSART